MQEVIDTEFRSQTVTSVLDRLTHIDRFDQVLALQYGKVIECEGPRLLLARDSAFRGLYRSWEQRIST